MNREYRGRIYNIDRLIISDPCYDKDVWCRYESNRLKSGRWDVYISIVDENFLNSNEFSNDVFNIKIKLESRYLKRNKYTASEYEIGIDSGQVSFSINEIANKISNKQTKTPSTTALATHEDGPFGYVTELSYEKSGIVFGLEINGWLNKNNGYTISYIIEYLSKNLKILNLTAEGIYFTKEEGKKRFIKLTKYYNHNIRIGTTEKMSKYRKLISQEDVYSLLEYELSCLNCLVDLDFEPLVAITEFYIVLDCKFFEPQCNIFVPQWNIETICLSINPFNGNREAEIHFTSGNIELTKLYYHNDILVIESIDHLYLDETDS